MTSNRHLRREAIEVLIVLTLAAGLTPASPTFAVEPTAAVSPPHTVTWYADNRPARAKRQLLCLDDPGHLRNTPDCINAEAASVTVALREARHRIGELDARKLAFWSEDPRGRYNKLLICRQNPHVENCNVARRSLELEASGK